MEEKTTAAAALATPAHVQEASTKTYTQADWDRLASGERQIAGYPESVVWGAVLVAWIAIAALPMLYATSDQIAGVKNYGRKFMAFSASWLPAFLLLLTGWVSGWHPAPVALGALAVAVLVWLGRHAYLARSRLTTWTMWRNVISVVVLWLLAVQFWGFIWRWDRYFNGAQFAALHASVPVLFVVAIVVKRWTRAAPTEK